MIISLNLRICFVSSLAFVSMQGLAAAPARCTADEIEWFGCNIGSKRVAVCSSSAIHADSGYLQYRFGTGSRIELLLPADPAALPVQGAVAGSLVFSGGGGAYLRFDSGSYSYVVYSAISSSWGEKDGILIEKDGRALRSLKCTSAVRSRLGPELFEKAGLRSDQREFLLPD